MKQQSLWEPMDGADMRGRWRALPEASRAELVDHLVRLVVRSQLRSLKAGERDGGSESGAQSTVADGDRRE